MGRVITRAVSAFVILVTLAPPVFAQAPAPKVTITGLFDQVTSAGRNFYDGDLSRTSDREWAARVRFRPDFEFQVGKVKAVLGLEIDLAYGQMGANDGGFPGNTSGANQGCSKGTSANGCLDLNTDVGGMIEIKWIYTEFPLTGKDSLLPFIPVETMARAGGQPWGRLANYKVVVGNGDFAGISSVTKFTPNINTNLAWIIAEDQLAGSNRGNPNTRTARGEDYALIVSPEFTPIKGLDLKPLFSWFHADGVTSGGARHNLVDIHFAGGTSATTVNNSSSTNDSDALGGGSPAGDPTFHENRYTIGLDARWRVGPFGLDPTFYYQWGQRNHRAIRSDGSVGKVTTDMSSYIIDLIGSYQLGPLLLEARAAYSPGNTARHNLTKSIGSFQPVSIDGGYWATWAALLGNGGIDYFQQHLITNMGRFISYDRYGMARLGFKATYNITPAFSLYTWVSPTWTAEEVDTDTVPVAGTGAGTTSRTTLGAQSWTKGDSSYIGTEVDLGLTWRFAPNIAFDLQGAYLFAGDALDTGECLTPGTAPTCPASLSRRGHAQDAYMLAARVRLAF